MLSKTISKRTRKITLYTGQVLLYILAISGFILAIRYFAYPRIQPVSYYNAGVDVLGMFVCAVLFFGCTGDKEQSIGTANRWFVSLIIINSLAFMNNELSWFLAGFGDYRIWYLLLNTLTKLFDFTLVFYFYQYVSAMLDFKGKLARFTAKWVQIWFIPALILIAVNFFTGICFGVDDNGEFFRTRLYPLVDLYLILVVPLTTILIYKSEYPRRQKKISASFIFIPIVHYIITGGAHGYATQYGSTLVAMIIIYCILFNDRSKKLTATKTELNMATQIQAAMLPGIFPPYPDRTEFDIYATMDPAKEVGGDFYDFYLIDDDHLCLVIADVSDKGVPAALFMMVSKVIIQSCAMLGRSPAEILTKTNEAICSKNPQGMFVTVWLGILEISTGKLTASNAGHEYPILMHPNGEYEKIKDPHGLFVGGMPGIQHTEYELQMEPGAKLFVYTDGVVEAKNPNKEMFGMDRLLKTLNADTGAEPKQVIQNVKAEVMKFVKDAEQFDDLTMLSIEYKGVSAQ